MSKRLTYVSLMGLFFCAAFGGAEDKITRSYNMKNADLSAVTSVINIAVRDPDKIRVMGGKGKHLVISDTSDQQDLIAQLLPIMDQPVHETDPDKIKMQMLMNVAQYLRQQKIALKSATPTATRAAPATVSASVSAPATAPAVQSADKFKPATPYKSVYEEEDAKMTRGPRKIEDEPVILSLGGLELKGIFRGTKGSPIALLSAGPVNYTARDGGLFEGNHVRVKRVTSRIRKDGVTLVGQDGIPHEIKFKTAL